MRHAFALLLCALALLPPLPSHAFAGEGAKPMLRTKITRAQRLTLARALLGTEIVEDQLRESMTIDTRKLWIDAHTYAAVDWPLEVSPNFGYIDFSGKQNGSTPGLRLYFRSAAALRYLVDCGASIRDASKITAEIQSSSISDPMQKKSLPTEKKGLDDKGVLSFVVSPNAMRDVRITLTSPNASTWTLYWCAITPVAS